MVTDPTQRRLINRLMWFTLMQGAILGIMLTLFAGMTWARNVVESETLLPIFMVIGPFNLFLLGTEFLINAKVAALRQQLHPRPGNEDAPLTPLISGAFAFSAGALVVGLEVAHDFALLVCSGVVVAWVLFLGYLIYRQRNRRAAHP